MGISDKTYGKLKQNQRIYKEWAQQFKKSNGWIIIPAYEETPVEFTNNDISKIEVYEWLRDKPEKYFLYIDEKTWTATTFTGDKLGKVFHGKKYRDNFGGIRMSITIYGTNKIKYYGTYYMSSGNYARIKAYSNQHI